MENVLAELYDALAQLRYPEIAKIELKDLAATVLADQNRIALLTWLLSHASPTLSSHLEKFQGTSLKDEIVKCYLQMGISNDENTLLGNCSAKQQISTLKALLLFIKSLDNAETVPIDDSAIYEVLDKHINETINIIPSSCHVSMKLSDSEAKKYLEGVKAKMTEKIYSLPESQHPETEPSVAENKINLESRIEIEDGQLLSLDSLAETFGAAFEAAEFLSDSRLSDLPNNDSVNLDETVENLYKDLSSVTQVFESKRAISAMKAPKCLDKYETPLSLLIEDNVIFSEQIKNLYEQDHLEN